MLKSRIVIFPCLVYGLAWLMAVNHPIITSAWLVFAGVIVGLALHLRHWIISLLKIIIILTILSFIAAGLEWFGVIIDAGVIVWLTYKRWSAIFKNILLIIVGIVLYILLFFWPHSLHNLIYDNDSPGFLDFIAGSILMIMIGYLFERAGYQRRIIYLVTIGLPGYLLMWEMGKEIVSPFVPHNKYLE